MVLFDVGWLLHEHHGLAAAATMIAAPVFAFGLVAFGFLGMGPGNDCRRFLWPCDGQRANPCMSCR